LDNLNKSTLDSVSLRFAVVSLVISKIGLGYSTNKAIAETIDHFKSSDDPKNLSRSTVFRWLGSYRKSGWQGLQKKAVIRTRNALSTDFIHFLTQAKRKDPKASIPEIIRLAKAKNIVGENQQLDRSTVYRHAVQLNLPILRQRKTTNSKRPFAYPHRMQMVLCDGKHFRAGVERLKRVVFTFLDDASRKVLGAIVGTSENSSLFLKGLHNVIANYGFMDHIYLDKGPGFIASAAERVSQNLDIPLIFGTTKYPEGHGKIERYNRTLLDQCLRGLAKPGIDPNLYALGVRINHFAKFVYGKITHSEIKTSPESRFESDIRNLKFPQNEQALIEAFTLHEKRKVRDDNVITFNDQLYEVPLGYAGTKITLFHNPIKETVSMIHRGKTITLSSPDLALNARERRRKTAEDIADHQPIVTTAAEIQFNKDFQTIVDIDGGFPIIEERNEKND